MASAEKKQPQAPASTAQPGMPIMTLIGISLVVALLSTVFSTVIQTAMQGNLLEWMPSLGNLMSAFSADSGTSAMSASQTGVWWKDSEDYLKNYECKHGYSIKVLSRDPLILFVENFLQPGEGDYFKNISLPRMKRSSVAESADNYYAESRVRTSSSAFLNKGEDKVVQCVERRGSMLSGIPLEDCEPLQVVWYTKGQKYEPHHDYFPRKDLTDFWSKKSGQRYVTILPYINDDCKGGATGFPKLKLEVKPKKDAAVMWFNVGLNEVEDHRTLHGGMPVEEGEKWAINMWQRKKIPGWDQGYSEPGADDHSY